MGEGRTMLAGSPTAARSHDGGPVTWEALSLLCDESRCSGDPVTKSPTSACLRVHATLGQEQASAEEVGHARGTTEADDRRRTGSRRAAYERRRRGTAGTGPVRAKAARVETNFRREP
jgi:hypothetical protein